MNTSEWSNNDASSLSGWGKFVNHLELMNRSYDPPTNLAGTLRAFSSVWDTFAFILSVLYTHLLYKCIEVSHPVYAILYQIALVSAILSLLNLGALIIMWPLNLYVLWHRFNMLTTTLFFVIYEIGWMTLSIVRFLMIVKRDNLAEVDLDRVRVLAKMSMWIGVIFYLTLLSVGNMLALVSLGWPQTLVTDFSPRTAFLHHLIVIGLISLPEVVNTVLYVKIYRFLQLNEIQVISPPIVVNEQNNFGGIYVGENPIIHDSSDQMSTGSSVQVQQLANASDEERALNALRTHLVVFLAAIPLAFLFMFKPTTLAEFLISMTGSIIRVHVPILVATRNIGKLSLVLTGYLEYLRSKFRLWDFTTNWVGQ